MANEARIRMSLTCTHALRAYFARVASPEGDAIPERGKSLYRIRH